MDEIEEMDGYDDVITTADEPEYFNVNVENQSLKNVMYNFLSSNLNVPNDITSIFLAAIFLIASWKALQIVIRLLLAVLWPIIAFSSLFFLLPLIGQEEILAKTITIYNGCKTVLIKILQLVYQMYK